MVADEANNPPSSIRRIAVVHWFPIEFYPPTTNLLDVLSSNDNLAVTTYTCHNYAHRTPYENPRVAIVRLKFPVLGLNRLIRLWRYLKFPLIVFAKLCLLRPAAVLYMEPQSSFAVYLYSLLFRHSSIFIHHHEYHDPHQFLRPGMRLVRFYHWLEAQRMFPRAVWISHTNQDRLRMFREDFPNISLDKLRELPNLPPQRWRDVRNLAWSETTAKPLRLVYVGSLSCSDTFIEEIVRWVEHADRENVELDVYSFNYSADVGKLFEECLGERVRFHRQGIEYNELPSLLANFHVGLILYKATTSNYQFNASNKLFEYLALGLDVWYPRQMLGVRPYKRESCIPRVVELDFDSLDEMDLKRLADRSELPSCETTESCEQALEELVSMLASHSTKGSV